jgi:hypothetical protein
MVEKEIEEEREREREKRDEYRKQALAEWHNSKRAEEKRKQIVAKMISKKPTSMTAQNADMTTRRKSIHKRNPQSFDTAIDVPIPTKNLIDEQFLNNVKISQLNKIQQNIQIITNQRLGAGSTIHSGSKRLNYFSP